MNEKLLHFIWKFRLFDTKDLFTTNGETIDLVQTGVHNIHAGPDFQNAKIRIGKTLWAGNVEIHINSGDWFLHKHERDAAYNNVILHVVYEAKDRMALRSNGEEIPTLELKNRIHPSVLYRYEELEKRKSWIPCAKFLHEADEFSVSNFLERLLIERLEAKVEQIKELLNESRNDWEQVMFQMIAGYLGAGINKEPFQLLAKNLRVNVWAKHIHEPLQIEAMVFGTAGMLDEDFDDEYPKQLRKEFLYLKRLHQLQPLEKKVWKFLRLRPSNFPTVRLAQLSALMCFDSKMFSRILEAKNVKAIHRLFDVDVSEYWQNHYRFDKPTKKVNSHLGTSMKNTLLINAVAPVLFAYGKYKDKEEYCDRAFALLQNCEAESNSIITGWKKLNQTPSSAAKSQALLQLKNEYCDKFRCVDCAIGSKILK
ncbi:MAG: DUF2851 family protein [Bacteroidetes bacterium]|nr:DUF2851 family protein [Bacteroidota bacterium]